MIMYNIWYMFMFVIIMQFFEMDINNGKLDVK